MRAAFQVAQGGAWSSGGAAVLRNLHDAAQRFPDMLTFEDNANNLLIPRNIATTRCLLGGRYVLMPQNAWPWAGPWGTPRETVRRSILRVLGEGSMARASGIIRLSGAIPAVGTQLGAVLPNVLDSAFETALSQARAQATSRADGAIVAVGSAGSYRNVPRLLRAYEIYQREGGRHTLTLVGGPWSRATLRPIEPALRRISGVSFVSVDRPTTISLLMTSAGAVFSSLVEASPFAVLEALAVQPRIVLSDISGHRDTAGTLVFDKAFFDPSSVEDITAALLRIEGNDPLVRADNRFGTSDGRHKALELWCTELVTHLDCAVQIDGRHDRRRN